MRVQAARLRGFVPLAHVLMLFISCKAYRMCGAFCTFFMLELRFSRLCYLVYAFA
ncbi:hypothetical protein HMPREF9248_0660 [Fannyhessea vaginae PB189-T1-4]|uniref:Lipoprotein n=1 Tax=Fannyhessea vaginae PB189-T1-4 TaxID=866774 RepID=A0ABN0AYJ5_9ACTN|nr:hypothetical protein HMPREF9248_0660 [Fannyhessea vaginae PB189-T1-4]